MVSDLRGWRYIRQSTLKQVINNTESTTRQGSGRELLECTIADLIA